MLGSLLLDTPALEATLAEGHPYHRVARGYVRYLLEQQVPVLVSTLSLAEVGQRFALDRLPLLPYLRLVAFNHHDALHAARLLTEAASHPHLALPRELLLVAGQALAHQAGALLTTPTEDTPPHPLARLFPERPPFRLLTLAESHEAAFGLTGTLF